MNKYLFNIYQVLAIVLVFAFIILYVVMQNGLYYLKDDSDGKTLQYIISTFYMVFLALLTSLLGWFYDSNSGKVRFIVFLLFVALILPWFVWSGIDCARIIHDVNKGLTSTSDKYGYLSIINLFLLVFIPALVVGFLKRRELFYYLLMLFLVGFAGFGIGTRLDQFWCRRLIEAFI